MQMLYCNRIRFSVAIDITKANDSYEFKICR